jgi:hypothetical protein
MRPRPWMLGSVAICLVIALNCAYAIDAAELAQAHELIVSFGGQVCAAVSTDATSRTTEVDGEIGLKLDGLFKKLAGLDVGLSGKSITAETRGILQSDIAKALQDRNECYLHVFDVVVKQVLRPVPPDPEARRMSGRWRSDGMKFLAFLNVVARGNRLFGTEFSESGAPYITYGGLSPMESSRVPHTWRRTSTRTKVRFSCLSARSWHLRSSSSRRTAGTCMAI